MGRFSVFATAIGLGGLHACPASRAAAQSGDYSDPAVKRSSLYSALVKEERPHLGLAADFLSANEESSTALTDRVEPAA